MKENRPYTECGGVYNKNSYEYEVIGKFAPSMKETLEESVLYEILVLFQNSI
jgi:hypothetical protein